MKRVFFAAALGSMGAALYLVPACGNGFAIDLSSLPEAGLPDGAFPDGAFPTSNGVGAACSATAPCRPGLTCGADAKCAPGRATEIGGACQISAECKDGYCDKDRKCAAAGTGDAGGKCTSDAMCKAGLRCNLVGLGGGECQPEGQVDLFGACTISNECFGGLICAENPQANNAKQCLPNPGIIGVPPKFEVACEADTGPVQAYFEVPKGAPLKDFFRLPFPNDIRSTGAAPNVKVDYKDFPVPGAGLLGYDAVDRWARYIEQTGTGFSSYSSVTFRFSGEIDFASLNGDKVTHWADLTDKVELGHTWSSTTGRNSFVCANSLTFRPPVGGVLKPGHTYGVYFTTAVKAPNGVPVARGADIAAMLAATDPGGALATSWGKYKPFREWLTSSSTAPDSILNAAVFTVGQTVQPGRDMPKFVEAATVVTPWTKCTAGSQSPCAQREGGRNCPATPVAGVDEYHAVLKMPLYQKGKLPFMTPADDGTFVPGAKQSTVDVCAAITTPVGASTELPVVVYAHGTGGSFRSHADDIGVRLAKTGIAVLGIDQVAHGTRRGAETQGPELIFFNFGNPAAAQGNVLQGAADQIALVKYAQTNPAIAGGAKLSATKIAYWGHSQGATEGAISMPYAQGVLGVLFSGEGGSLIDSLTTKTSPTNLLALAPFIIGETYGVDANHPVLTLFQNGIDPADPMNHARNMNPSAPVPADIVQKHVFVPYGQLDTYATPITQRVYITAANLAVAPSAPGFTPGPNNIDALPAAQPGPVTKNNGDFTAVTRQYPKPANDDGHFVVFQDAAGIADSDKFMKQILVDGVAPSIP